MNRELLNIVRLGYVLFIYSISQSLFIKSFEHLLVPSICKSQGISIFIQIPVLKKLNLWEDKHKNVEKVVRFYSKVVALTLAAH
jgi:hypothetical protein